ncbi:MAG: hypothetical protein U0610_20475 [bacterium]
MPAKPTFDVLAAHRFFAADCFNKAWNLIEKQDRSPAEDRQMIALNQASIFHWTQRPDCAPKNLSIGYWQASRIHVLLGLVGEAKRYGQICLDLSQGLDAFYLGYAHEALARAEMAAGRQAEASAHLAKARALANQIADPAERELLLADLATLA